MPSTDAFVIGYMEAQEQFQAMLADVDFLKDFINPYQPGTEEYRGFEACIYDLIQK